MIAVVKLASASLCTSSLRGHCPRTQADMLCSTKAAGCCRNIAKERLALLTIKTWADGLHNRHAQAAILGGRVLSRYATFLHASAASDAFALGGLSVRVGELPRADDWEPPSAGMLPELLLGFTTYPSVFLSPRAEVSSNTPGWSRRAESSPGLTLGVVIITASVAAAWVSSKCKGGITGLADGRPERERSTPAEATLPAVTPLPLVVEWLLAPLRGDDGTPPLLQPVLHASSTVSLSTSAARNVNAGSGVGRSESNEKITESQGAGQVSPSSPSRGVLHSTSVRCRSTAWQIFPHMALSCTSTSGVDLQTLAMCTAVPQCHREPPRQLGPQRKA
mmetsp:Transcript_79854/g.213463  ORF Transcript_79854/g.213463 Transcript_79854/m.213463 type:complete len:335 (-) Transcript_79854:4-1008(-)